MAAGEGGFFTARATFLSLPVGLVAVCFLCEGGLGIGLLGLAILVLLASRWPFTHAPASEPERGEVKTTKAPADGHMLMAAFMPSTGIFDLCQAPHTFENDFGTCKVYALVRPTHDPERNKAGDFLHAAHFGSRRRLWEIRFQLQVKTPPRRQVFLSLELAEYKPTAGWVRRLQQSTVSTLRGIVGKDLHHSLGDDPTTTSGESERPCFAMPLWAFDQLIVSPAGAEPDLTDIAGQGVIRADNRSAFIRQMTNLEFTSDKVYTMSFWCISRFVDVVNWHMLGIMPGGVSFNTFCGRPPVHVVIYELEDALDPNDQRHLQSRKKYYFNMALWSAFHPPEDRHLQAFAAQDRHSEPGPEVQKSEGGGAWCCFR